MSPSASTAIPRPVRFALATSPTWERAVRSLPRAERSAYRRAERYVAGARQEDALAYAKRLADDGLSSSIDLFGESVASASEADGIADRYVELARSLGRAPENTFLSIDLSHIGLGQPGDGVRRRLERIAAELPPGRRIQVGAEEERRAAPILAAVLEAARAGARVSATVQANLERCRADAHALAEHGVPIRLVKGAFVEHPQVARAWGEPTDLAFLELARELHGHGAEIALATHDPVLREALLPTLPGAGVEMLLGVREADARALAGRGVPVRIYVPYGENWFRYAMRRWAESAGA